jgi:hypothetical protein
MADNNLERNREATQKYHLRKKKLKKNIGKEINTRSNE